MNIINTLDSKRFTLNGIQYFKNYISVVRGDRIEIFNCYERKDVLVPLTGFEYFEVNGTLHNSATSLQQALIDVLYTRSAGGEGSPSQNNTGRYITISPRRGINAPASTIELAQYINISVPTGLLSGGFMTITETNTPVFIASTAKVDDVYYKHVFVFLGGKGTWGSLPYGTGVTSSQFKLLSVTALIPEDIEPENIIELGEIAGGFLAAANAQERDFRDEKKSHYLSYYTGSILNVSLFTGEPGIYGGEAVPLTETDFSPVTKSTIKPSPVTTLQELLAKSGNTTLPMVLSSDDKKINYSGEGFDYINVSGNKVKLRYADPVANVTHTIPAKPSNDTFAMLSDLKLWKTITIMLNGTTIQNNAFIGAASIDMIIANNQLSTEGYSFDPVTGTISGWEVYAGEKHVIFYSKS